MYIYTIFSCQTSVVYLALFKFRIFLLNVTAIVKQYPKVLTCLSGVLYCTGFKKKLRNEYIISRHCVFKVGRMLAASMTYNRRRAREKAALKRQEEREEVR